MTSVLSLTINNYHPQPTVAMEWLWAGYISYLLAGYSIGWIWTGYRLSISWIWPKINMRQDIVI